MHTRTLVNARVHKVVHTPPLLDGDCGQTHRSGVDWLHTHTALTHTLTCTHTHNTPGMSSTLGPDVGEERQQLSRLTSCTLSPSPSLTPPPPSFAVTSPSLPLIHPALSPSLTLFHHVPSLSPSLPPPPPSERVPLPAEPASSAEEGSGATLPTLPTTVFHPPLMPRTNQLESLLLSSTSLITQQRETFQQYSAADQSRSLDMSSGMPASLWGTVQPTPTVLLSQLEPSLSTEGFGNQEVLPETVDGSAEASSNLSNTNTDVFHSHGNLHPNIQSTIDLDTPLTALSNRTSNAAPAANVSSNVTAYMQSNAGTVRQPNVGLNLQAIPNIQSLSTWNIRPTPTYISPEENPLPASLPTISHQTVNLTFKHTVGLDVHLSTPTTTSRPIGLTHRGFVSGPEHPELPRRRPNHKDREKLGSSIITRDSNATTDAVTQGSTTATTTSISGNAIKDLSTGTTYTAGLVTSQSSTDGREAASHLGVNQPNSSLTSKPTGDLNVTVPKPSWNSKQTESKPSVTPKPTVSYHSMSQRQTPSEHGVIPGQSDQDIAGHGASNSHNIGFLSFMPTKSTSSSSPFVPLSASTAAGGSGPIKATPRPVAPGPSTTSFTTTKPKTLPCQCKHRFHFTCLCGLSSGNSMSCKNNANCRSREFLVFNLYELK